MLQTIFFKCLTVHVLNSTLSCSILFMVSQPYYQTSSQNMPTSFLSEAFVYAVPSFYTGLLLFPTPHYKHTPFGLPTTTTFPEESSLNFSLGSFSQITSDQQHSAENFPQLSLLKLRSTMSPSYDNFYSKVIC